MTTELKEAIEILSPAVEKITNTVGQGFDFTYQVLLKQVYVSSLQDVSTLVILLSIGYLLYWWLAKDWKKKKNNYMNKWSEPMDFEFKEEHFWFTVYSLLVSIYSCIVIQGVIQALVNPDYEVIKQLLNVAKAVAHG